MCVLLWHKIDYQKQTEQEGVRAWLDAIEAYIEKLERRGWGQQAAIF